MSVKQIAVAELERNSLAELAGAAASGDAEAFGEIYRLLADDVYRYVRAQCSNEEACDDIVAEVFLKAWDRAQTQDSAHHRYRSWIFTIARNEVRDHWRREGRAGDLVAAMNGTPREGAGEEPDQADVRRFVAAALVVLTEEQREVVMLRLLAGLSTEEVARMLETNEGAVRALQFRALRRMKAATREVANT